MPLKIDQQPPKWKDEPDIIYSLDNDNMYSVNQTHAIEQLQYIHGDKYERAIGSAGPVWVIPMADNVSGLGKSEFGDHYIKKCRETWPNEGERTDFQKTLCACHTIKIVFDRGILGS